MVPHPQLDIFFLPLMAPGHTNPMMDMARLLAERGVRATVVTTPSNAPLLRSAIDKARRSGHLIDLLLLPFPSCEARLPKGRENLTSLPSPEISEELFAALELFCQSLDQVLRDHLPDCIIFDCFLPWTADIAVGLHIPCLVFHAMGFFPLSVSDSLRRHATEGFGGDGTVLVPGLPHRVEMKVSQLPDSVRTKNKFSEFMDQMVESELKSCGAVVNSFYEMEPDYANHYRDVMGTKVWHVGPVSLCNRDNVDMAGRGVSPSSSSIHGSIVAWLDSKPPDSVLYVCFGSLCRLTAAQLQEIAVGLEDSNHPFIWVVRDDGPEPEGSEGRVREEGRGLIVRGWAPQMLILNHRSVGGFVTHCGWNSVMEGVSAGVPMITWPLFAEQFYNERLVVDVLRIGVSVGVETWSMSEEEKPVVMGAEVGRAVARVMDGGEEADGVRRRAGELREKARRAVVEGGSSHADVSRLIGEIVTSRSGGGNAPCLHVSPDR